MGIHHDKKTGDLVLRDNNDQEVARYRMDADEWDFQKPVSTEETDITQMGAAPSYSIYKRDGSIRVLDMDRLAETDSASEIATLINSIVSGWAGATRTDGGEAFLRTGEYDAAGTIGLEHQSTLRGEGGYRSAVIQLQDAVDANLVEFVNDTADNWHNAGLYDIYIHGNKGNNTAGHCFYANSTGSGSVADFHAERAFAQRAVEDGFHCEDLWGFKFERCVSEDNDGVGFYLNNGAQWYLASNFSAYNGSHGYVLLGDRGTADRLFSWQNGGQGFRLGGTHQQLGKCLSHQDGSDGFFLAGTRSTLSTCIAHAATGDGFTTGNGPNKLDTCWADGCNIGFNLKNPARAEGIWALDNSGYGVRVDSGSVLVGVVSKNNSNTDIQITSGATDATIIAAEYGTIADNGTRTLINGRGTNAGDPSSTGQWNGNAARAEEWNAVIEDTTNSNLYMAKSDGTWSQIGA